jgi:hypothetical protein
MNPIRLLVSLLITLLLTAPAFPIEPPLLPQVIDLKRLGNTAESRGLPILLMVSQSDCGYCEQMKRQVLNPMQLSSKTIPNRFDKHGGDPSRRRIGHSREIRRALAFYPSSIRGRALRLVLN